MRLLDALFRSKAVEKVLSDESVLARMLEVEAALALALSDSGLIPSSAARTIQSCCVLENLNTEQLLSGAKRSGNLVIPLVKQLTLAVEAVDPEAAKYVHWGATSQDIIDSALVLQSRDAVSRVLADIARSCVSLRELTGRYRHTVMPGRTWMQHALPVTFGLKTAQMLYSLHRQSSQLRTALHEISVLQFGGAAGTLAALGDRGPRVAEGLASRLELANPPLPWHSNRERIAELATALGVLSGALGKIARDISLLTQTEVAELTESREQERGGSSAMPHKVNPVASAAVLANVARIPGLVSTVLTAMVQEHERGLGGWHAEWETLPELISLTAGAAERTAELFSTLEVHPERMRANLELTRGLIFSEAVSMALANKIGKQAAHSLIERAARVAQEQQRHLRDVLSESEEVRDSLTSEELSALFQPESYLGSTQIFIDRVLDDCSEPLEVSNAAR